MRIIHNSPDRILQLACTKGSFNTSPRYRDDHDRRVVSKLLKARFLKKSLHYHRWDNMEYVPTEKAREWRKSKTQFSYSWAAEVVE